MLKVYTTDKQKHFYLAQEFYSEMRACTEMSRQNDNIACIAFNFKQNLPIPHIPTNEIFI